MLICRRRMLMTFFVSHMLGFSSWFAELSALRVNVSLYSDGASDHAAVLLHLLVPEDALMYIMLCTFVLRVCHSMCSLSAVLV